ncbi:Atypical/Alpha protein kinase [Mycena venus]|uniref:Atypical/Alpha protein kinase n=1 Tax=Mycena venus TaxID=2733690 RepID=A0A8H6Z466_9AGAR|nr:Atypical/Alpha protein kinase [Mycena venus]
MPQSMCASEENGQEDPHAAAARKFRHERLQRSMGGPLQNVGNQQFGASTSIQELEHLKTSSQKGLWTLLVHPHRGAAKDKEMDVKTKIMAHYDDQWTSMKDHALSLKPNECSLRLSGNIDMDPATQDMTIQNVYGFYQGRPDRAVVNVDSKLKLPKGTSMVFEFYINEKLYMDRVASMMGRRRRRFNRWKAKRAKTGVAGTLKSTFNLDDDYSALTKRPETFKVTFATIRCEPEGTEGRHVLIKDCVSRTGAIEVNTLILSVGDRGKSKDVHKFRIEGDTDSYIAKKIFDIGKGRGVEVTPATNKSVLSHDLFRLKRLAWFHKGFLKRASEKGLTELAEFSISEGFMILIQEDSVVDANNDANDDDAPDADSYLVEPLRTSSVVHKFTGTFGASRGTDKLTSTILAFNHYCMEDTACLLAFADLQGSRHGGGMVLFDPMTHTIKGTSGTGDHGPKGIRDTINDHTCNIFCKALELSSVDILHTALEDRITEEGGKDPDALVSHQSSDNN